MVQRYSKWCIAGLNTHLPYLTILYVVSIVVFYFNSARPLMKSHVRYMIICIVSNQFSVILIGKGMVNFEVPKLSLKFV